MVAFIFLMSRFEDGLSLVVYFVWMKLDMNLNCENQIQHKLKMYKQGRWI